MQSSSKPKHRRTNTVHIRWEFVVEDNEALLSVDTCLYAYIDAQKNELVYIGKCYGTTVHERWNAEDKDLTFDRIARLGTPIKDIALSVGLISLSDNKRFSAQLVQDLESLLIFEEQPCGNIQNRASRGFGRPGLVVDCSGHWPGSGRYIDPGPTP